MDFVELVGAGLLVAGATAGLGVWIAKTFTDKAQEAAAERERKAAEAAEAAAAERERTRAAATEFSRAYGQSSSPSGRPGTTTCTGRAGLTRTAIPSLHRLRRIATRPPIGRASSC